MSARSRGVETSVSVIIPTYNKHARLEHTLSALADQHDPPPFEVLVVDDGSSDQTPQFLADLPGRKAATWSRLRVLGDGRNRGRAAARNRGLSAARSSYVVFLDDDCTVGHRFIAAHHRIAAANPGNVMVLGSTLLAHEVTTQPLPEDTLQLHRSAIAAVDSGRWSTAWSLFVTNHAGVSTRTARDVGGFDEDFVGWGEEDIDFGYRLHLAGAQARGLPEFVIKESHPRDLGLEGSQWIANYVRFVDKHDRPSELLFRWQTLMGLMSIYEYEYLCRGRHVSTRRRAEREFEAFVTAARQHEDHVQNWLRIREGSGQQADPLFTRRSMTGSGSIDARTRSWLVDPDQIAETLDRMAAAALTPRR